MIHGWIILDKPLGMGSTTAVSAVKRILRQADEPKTKVGHGGTLDPLASGVLPIALGEATSNVVRHAYVDGNRGGMRVRITVADTEPGVQGDRVSGAKKPATLETGAVVQVPLFINVGDRVKVDTRTGEYISKA